MAFSESEREFFLEKEGMRFPDSNGSAPSVRDGGFINSTRPQSKPVEGTGGRLQNLMNREPGYTGHDERTDCSEEVKHWERELARSNPQALNYFYDFKEWKLRLGEIIERYNGERHGINALKIPGLSPDEAFDNYWPRHDPPSKPDAACRIYFASARFEDLVVNEKGITVEFNGETFRYIDRQTGERIGQKVIAWVNPNAMENLVFTDPNWKNAFTVERQNPVNRLRTDGRYLEEVAKIEGHYSALKTEYSASKAKFHQTFRKNIVNKSIVEIDAQVAKAQARQAEHKARGQKLRRQAESLGIPSALVRGSTREELSAVEMIEDARREHAENLKGKGQ